jgi:DNA polymerase-3 subunit gamma/tau
LRDLLVCQDASTLTLLEVSDAIRKKYQQQAQAATASFFLSALSIASACEQSYKNSKDQRLQIEIALLKLASLKQVFSVQSLIEDIKKKVRS